MVSIIRWHAANLPPFAHAQTFGFHINDGAFQGPGRGFVDSVGSRGIA
jgi:hypothetical protein